MIYSKLFLRIVTLPSRLRDLLFNRVFSILCDAHIQIVWSEVKIFGVEQIHFGDQFSAGRGLWLETIGSGRIIIGANINMSDWVHIGALDNVSIGDGCLLGSKVLITDHSHGVVSDIINSVPQRPNDRKLRSKGPVTLEDNVWLGDGVIILPNVRIGSGAIVGANSVVTTNIPNNTVWAGTPAKQIWPKCTK
jgi:acetyltransferase-like isoleucine patch superfamily enzyme